MLKPLLRRPHPLPRPPPRPGGRRRPETEPVRPGRAPPPWPSIPACEPPCNGPPKQARGRGRGEGHLQIVVASRGSGQEIEKEGGQEINFFRFNKADRLISPCTPLSLSLFLHPSFNGFGSTTSGLFVLHEERQGLFKRAVFFALNFDCYIQ